MLVGGRKSDEYSRHEGETCRSKASEASRTGQSRTLIFTDRYPDGSNIELTHIHIYTLSFISC